jgi:hypothetical protein
MRATTMISVTTQSGISIAVSALLTFASAPLAAVDAAEVTVLSA